MNDDTRDLDNLTDYLMRATHDQLMQLVRSLLFEVIARGLPGDGALSNVVSGLRRSTSAPRAAPLARP